MDVMDAEEKRSVLLGAIRARQVVPLANSVFAVIRQVLELFSSPGR